MTEDNGGIEMKKYPKENIIVFNKNDFLSITFESKIVIKEYSFNSVLEGIKEKRKQLSNLEKEIDEFDWQSKKFKLLDYLNYQKFKQNKELKEKLIQTNDSIIIACLGKDTTLGVGLNENDSAILDISNWKGQNILGKSLMRIRNDLV